MASRIFFHDCDHDRSSSMPTNLGCYCIRFRESIQTQLDYTDDISSNFQWFIKHQGSKIDDCFFKYQMP